jgi:hypothetical protein
MMETGLGLKTTQISRYPGDGDFRSAEGIGGRE